MIRGQRCRQWLGILAGWLAALAGCATPGQDLAPLPTVVSVDLTRYAGTWYEIASFPQWFQSGCVATRAIYTLREGGDLGVYNECRKNVLDGPVKSVEGRARVVDTHTNARLQVSFFRPFWGDYWIVDLDPDYRWAVVGHPSRKYLWILSRTRRLDQSIYERIVARLPALGYDPGLLRRTLQPED